MKSCEGVGAGLGEVVGDSSFVAGMPRFSADGSGAAERQLATEVELAIPERL